jgi:thioredoxin 1
MEDVTLEQIEQLSGSVLLEFGAEWCGYCRAAQPLIQSALAEHRDVRHIKIEDGKGKRLGRQFGVKLWPSLIFLKDGKEIGRLVRPHDAEAIMQLLAKLNSPQAETDRQ